MLVINAHKVTDDSGEGFAVRLYRQGRPGAPLAAFSDNPHAFRLGFNKVGLRGLAQLGPPAAATLDIANKPGSAFVQQFWWSHTFLQSTPYVPLQLEKVMRALQLRVLLLYPRFHEAVAADLEADAASVRGTNLPIE